MPVLDRINQANDIKKLTKEELKELPQEIRDFLIEHVSRTGGHLASNLGSVELTMALHLLLDFPKDKLIWDVGHQSYVHKILTGRREEFAHLRQFGGISGFPKKAESDCDCYETGHSSTSVSAGLGMVCARETLGEDYTVVSVIGDGAITGGMALEAFNNASEIRSNFIIVLNDNHMSISENIGGLANHLAGLRTARHYQDFKKDVHKSLNSKPYGKLVAKRMHNAKNSLKQLMVPGMFFENIGITYLGPVNGHDLSETYRILKAAKKVHGAVVVHIQTDKGRGYEPASRHPEKFHGISAFDPQTGRPVKKKENVSYTDVFSSVICDIASENPRVAAITAAMTDGTGLQEFHRKFPERFYDVGIAEGHAVGFAAGLATAGMHPVFAVYSSFLQRGFDQLIVDVCLQNLPVVFAIDRAGLVGADGDTHQGIFDLSYLAQIPNMTVMAPKNQWELANMLRFAFSMEAPVAIRYPRGDAYDGFAQNRERIQKGKSETLIAGKEIMILAVGAMVEEARRVCEILEKEDIHPTLVNARFVQPLDEELLDAAASAYALIVTMEENVSSGGFGERVSAYLKKKAASVQVINIAIPDCFVQHGSVAQLRKLVGIDADTTAGKILETMGAARR